MSMWFQDELKKKAKEDKEITTVRFINSHLTEIPKGLTGKFTNLTKIVINYGSFVLKKNDFAEYKNLKELWVSYCNVESLPGDVFHLMPQLTAISFFSCNLKYIGADILDRLLNLTLVKFDRNVNINAVFDKYRTYTDRHYFNAQMCTLENLKILLMAKQLRAPRTYRPHFDQDSEMESVLNTNNFADIKFIVEEHEFNLHRAILEREDFFKEIFNENPNSVEFYLEDVSKNAFKSILHFIYEGHLILKNFDSIEDLVNLIAYADDLNMERIKHLIIKKLEEKFSKQSKRQCRITNIKRIKSREGIEVNETIATTSFDPFLLKGF